jgi:8-oxo-dGTP pyrophosphatase MutT (NUDIX family)
MSDLHDDDLSPELLASETVFRGRVWDIRRERFLLEGSEITREFMAHTGAVAVLAMDERDRVVLIKQYRHPIRSRDWELPAGLLDVAGESPLLAAQRELAEEADLVAESWAVLSDFWTTPGGSDEWIRVYLARGVSAAPAAHDRTEEEAGIELRWVSLDEAVDAVLERRIQNAIVGMAVLAARLGQDRGWSTLAPADAPWPRHPSQRPGN